MTLRRLLLAVLLFSPTLPSNAEFRTNVNSISRREGLSNGAVTSIVKDAEGYIWFGTWNGLNRYNGGTIETYLPGNSPGAIHNHVIRELWPTAGGPVWMLTNKGIALYNNINDRFTAFFTHESEQINYENDIAIGHSDGYGTFASVLGRGIFRFDYAAGGFEKMEFEKGSVQASLSVTRIHVTAREVFFITITGSLMRLNGTRLEEVARLPLTGALISSLYFHINERPRLLFTQRSGPALMADPETGEVNEFDIPGDVITSLALSRDQTLLWAGTGKGQLYRLDPATRTFTRFERFSGARINNQLSTRIISIFESEPDILWIGTDGNGVYTLKLTEFPNRRLSSGDLAYPIVRSLLVNRRGDLLVGTKGGGIDIFDAAGKLIKRLSEMSGLSNNSVLSMLERDDGSIWVGTDGQGIDIISPGYGTIRNFPRDFRTGNPLTFSSVYRIMEDGDHHIFLGTSGYGVIMVEVDKNNISVPLGFTQVILDKNIDAAWQQKQIVYAIAEEKPGIIWIGTRGSGIYRYNTITRRIIAQYSTVSHPGLIRNDDILCLLADPGGNILAGSSNGIFSLVPLSADSARVTAMKSQPELTNTCINAIQADAAGNLWLTTRMGLSLAGINREIVRSFTTNDGLINFEYSDGASFFDRKTGQLYVGGTMGVDIIQTEKIRFSSWSPPLSVNRLLIRNQPVEIVPEGILTSRINLQNSIRLPGSQNSFAFDVSALAYWGQDRYRISFRLLNFDDEWTITPPNQLITFSNLKPGKYTLQMRVSDENGDWPAGMREIRITIDPPIWLTAWAIGLYILLFIGIQLIIIKAYRRRLARKEENILREFQKKKEEELQSYKIEFFTNVAHEFRTPLTLISSHIHTLLENTRNTAENPRLLKVFNNSIKLQKLVLEIMQFRKLEKGKEPLHIRLTNPVDLVTDVISDLELFAEQRDIRCVVTATDPAVTFLTDADKFQRIITNLISNAIKYNREGGTVNAILRLENGALTVEVEDTGVGIRPGEAETLFEPFGIASAHNKGASPGYRSTGLGLAVTKGLVELLKGTIRFENRPEEGTRFTCVFPDVHELSPPELQDEPVREFAEPRFMDESGLEIPFENRRASATKPLILLIDDDPEILVLLKEFLEADYNIIFAGNGREAYHKVITDRPDLIVSDVVMPEMDGIELCRRIRDNFDTSHLPVILLAARAEIEDRIAGLKAGADSYIPKPFNPEHLKVRIRKLLQLRASILNQFAKPEGNHALAQSIPDPFFQKLLSFIDENLDDEHLSSDKLCDKLAISKSALYNKTRSVLGTTPHSLIFKRRLNKAAILLKSSSMTVSEIIDQTGFASRTHFYDLFNRSYGCSPSDYRKKPADYA